MDVAWLCDAKKMHHVLWRGQNGPWIEMTNGITGDDDLVSVTNSITGDQQFFRVYLEQ
jgi:hypothetical protein